MNFDAEPGNIIAIVILMIVIFFVCVAIFQFLWNITMPQVFGLRTITYWQAFRLLLISGFLFGGSWVRFHS